MVLRTTDKRNKHIEIFFRCGSKDHLIAKCLKPPKDNEKRQKQVHFNEKGNCACDNSKTKIDQKIDASMDHMSKNDEFTSINFDDSSQLTNWILNSVATCHMTPEVSDFIPGSLEDTDKQIEVADVYHVIAGGKSSNRNKTVRRSWISFHCNVTQRTFGTRFIRQVIFNRYLHEFRTYLFIMKRVLYCILRSKI